MSNHIKGHATFRCGNCGEKYSLNDFDFNPESGYGRGMGSETQHISIFEQTCDKCNYDISIEFEVWEYPEGAFNSASSLSTSATHINAEFDFVGYDEGCSNEEENTRVVGAAAGGAILGASLGGPFGALVGGVIGGILGDSVNKSNKAGDDNG